MTVFEPARRGAAPLLLACALMAVGGCDCTSTPIVPTTDRCEGVEGLEAGKNDACDIANPAACGDHFACKAVKDRDALTCCQFSDRACTTSADCCAGQVCNTSRKKCFDERITCATDADCGSQGDRVCEVYADTYGTESRCRQRPCGAQGACAEGLSCFQGECVAGLPCEGTCPAGSACVPSSGKCQDYLSPTNRAAAACPVSCTAGFIGSFKDNRNIWDSCSLPAVQCVCAELPGLVSNDVGRFSALAADPGKGLLVSAYDGTYGDLVVVKFEGPNFARAGVDYVDGVPAGGASTFGPSGPRGGVTAPGDDVGRYTDIATFGGKAFVSYYDATRGDLKVAVRSAEGAWSSHRVDGATADVGLYSSIAVDSDGLAGVAYFQRGGDASFDASSCPTPVPTGPKAFITALKFAKATSPNPGAGADWQIKTIACQSRPTPACNGCGAPALCADPGTGPACLAAATGCAACDANTEVCAEVAGVPTCATRFNPSQLVDVTDGVGLFSALAFNGKDAFIAYMKRTTPPPMGTTRFPQDGDLYGVRIGAQGTASPPVLLEATGDTGWFPDVKIDPATRAVAVSFHDFSSKALRYYQAATFQTGVATEVVDPGTGAPGSGEAAWVGTDSAIVFAGGAVYVAYQDATHGDLKLAKRGSPWQLRPPIASDGAVGFFADGVFVDGKLVVSHARYRARLVASDPKVDNALLLEAVTPN